MAMPLVVRAMKHEGSLRDDGDFVRVNGEPVELRRPRVIGEEEAQSWDDAIGILEEWMVTEFEQICDGDPSTWVNFSITGFRA